MSLEYAVDRLYELGWLPEGGPDLERLSDGRRYPTVAGVQRLFAKDGLRLAVKENEKFRCYQATWSPLEEATDPRHPADDRHGTVVGGCDREAAVYAMAQYRASQAELQMAAS